MTVNGVSLSATLIVSWYNPARADWAAPAGCKPASFVREKDPMSWKHIQISRFGGPEVLELIS